MCDINKNLLFERDFKLKKDDVESSELSDLLDLRPPLLGKWRHSELMLFCGTLRIARFNLDTAPSPEFQVELMDWICKTLNEKQI